MTPSGSLTSDLEHRDPPHEDGGPSHRRRAELYLFSATFIWGSTFTVVKIGLIDLSPLAFISLRFFAAGFILTVLFYGRIRTIDAATLQKGIVLGLLLCFGFVAQTVGLQYTTASKSGFITGLLVVFTPIMQYIIERQFPKVGNLIGVAGVTVGLYLLTSPEGSSFNFGDGLTLTCAVLFAIYIVYLDLVSKEVDTFHLTYLQIITTGAVCLGLAILFEDIQIIFSPAALFSLGYLVLFATLLSTYIQTRYQKETTPTRAAVIFSIEPVISAVLAYFILDEIIGGLGIVGGGMIVLGLIISQTSDRIPLLNRSLGDNVHKGV